MIRSALLQSVFLVALAIPSGLARQYFPHGIAWNGRWPTSATSAEEAYKMMAKPGDPAFVPLAEMIEIQEKKSATIIDARSSDEYAAGHLPHSRSLPYYELD